MFIKDAAAMKKATANRNLFRIPFLLAGKAVSLCRYGKKDGFGLNRSI
jgi:hypothetical protein